MMLRAVGFLTVAAATAWAPGPAAAAGGSWQSIGPSGGSVGGLAIDPSSTQTLYALAGGGLFKTRDGGRSWFHSDAGLLPGPVAAVSIDPRSPSRIYAAVGGFVFRSGDGGLTWTQAGRPAAGFPLTCLVIDPQSPQTLYAGCGAGNVVSRSVDEGASWVALDTGPGASVLTLAIDPLQPAIYAGTTAGIWKSVDSGASWQAASKGMGTPAPAVLAITVDPVKRGTVYAGTQSVTQSEPGGLYVSRNGGATWRLLLAQPNPAGVSCLVISPAARRPLYACSAGLFKSSDSGRSWQQLDGGLGSAAIAFLVLDPASPVRLYAGDGNVLNAGGTAVYTTANSGGSWQPAGSGISATSVTALAVDPVQQGTLFLGTANAGLFKTTNDGAQWTPADLGLRGSDVLALAIDPQSPATLYAETNRAFFATHDGGARWFRPGARFAGGPPLVVDAQTPTTLYSVSGSSLYRSLDGGLSWTQTYSWMDRQVPLPAALAIAPSAPSTLYLGTNGAGTPGTRLEVSHDGGTTFQPLPGTLPIISIDVLAVDPTDANTLYVAATIPPGIPFPGHPQSFGTVFKSQDAGQTFAELPIEVPGAAVTALLIDPVHPAVIYGATGSGFFSPDSDVMVSRDGGAGWSQLAPGLPGLPVVQLALGPAGTMYAGTQGAGAYKLVLVSK